jgi:hypothetical protein
MTTSASITTRPRPIVVQVWGLQGTTTYCDECKFDTTHNGAAHRAGRHQQQRSP